MKQLLVYGGMPLFGKVQIEGAKNSALPVLFACLLSGETSIISRTPAIGDIHMAIQMLEAMGAKIRNLSPHRLEINTSKCRSGYRDTEHATKLRGSLYYLGAGLARFGEAYCCFPGGCNLGKRPIDQHLKVLEALGADVNLDQHGIYVKGEKLVGTDFSFDVVSVGATINGMLAATKAQGITRLRRVAKEPHVVDVANYLSACGCEIEGAGTDCIIINGGKELHGANHILFGDDIEAGTYLIAAAGTAGCVTVEGVKPAHLETLIASLQKIGAKVNMGDDYITVIGTEKLTPLFLETGPFPAFPSDLHPPMTALMTKAKGISRIKERVWKERFRYIEELKKMGAIAKEKDATLDIYGGERLFGGVTEATDLRGGAALVVAALMADGITVIENLPIIERGYENLAKKLQMLGAKIYQRG